MLGQPSVIARLMGMEAPMVVPVAEETTIINLLTARPPSSYSSGEASPAKVVAAASKLKQFKCSAFPHHGRINVEYYRYCLSKMKPRRRSRRDRSHHHPQEELLEKIKEEFRASWQQASMATSPLAEVEVEGNAAASASGRRSSSAADRAGWVDVDGRYIQRVAQENLRREKMARYGHGVNGKTKVEEVQDIQLVAEAERHQGGSEDAAANVAESEAVSSDSHRAAQPEEFSRDSGGSEALSGDHDHMSSASENTPTRIAILRPIGTTLAAAGDHGEPARDGGMEEFLRAVKERLDNEMKAKTGAAVFAPPTTTTRRRQWESAEPEQDTARRIREAAGMAKEDLGRRLSRLESFRVFRGDLGRRAAAAAVKSPEHRMLKRVRARIEAMSPKKTRLSGSSSPVSSRGGRARSSPPADAGHGSPFSGVGSDYEEEVEVEEQSCCCSGNRQCQMSRLWKVHGAARVDADTGTNVVVSPRALVRSFSAPATSRVTDGASETDPDTSCEGAEVNLKLSRSRSFSLLRGTVASGLKQSFSLLLMHLTKKSPPPSSPQDLGHRITVAQADFLAGLAPPSPVSPLEVHGRSPRHSLPESSPRRSPKCSSEFEASVVGAESPWRWKIDAAAEPDKAYVRELLVAAGLLDDDDDDGGGESSEDTAAEPTIIPDDVFYEVEDAYYYRRLRRRVYEDGAGEEEEEDGWTDRRRLLFDLANEALQAGPSTSLSLRRWIVDSGEWPRLRLLGRDLEDEVWRHVARAMTDDNATTVDGMVERDVRKSPWMDALREDVCAVGRKVERAIFDELVGEVLRQVFVRT